MSGGYANLRAFAAKLGKFDRLFETTDFKYIDNLRPEKAFKDLRIFPVAELVFYGLPRCASVSRLKSISDFSSVHEEHVLRIQA